VSLTSYYQSCRFRKPARAADVKRQANIEQALERRTRTYLDTVRDKHVCCVPGCSRYATHHHHVVPRSLGGTWDSWNIVSACPTHHRWFHGRLIEAHGNPDDGGVLVTVTPEGERCGVRVPPC